MNSNTPIKQAAVASPIDANTQHSMPVQTQQQIREARHAQQMATGGTGAISPSGTATLEAGDGIQYAEMWKVLRGVLVVWAIAVWLLLVMMPGAQQISDMASAMMHLPHMFIGLGLIGAIFASYSLRSDIHMLWFLGVLLLLAGWM